MCNYWLTEKNSELFRVTQLKALQLNLLLQLFISFHELIHSISVQFHIVLRFNKEVKYLFFLLCNYSFCLDFLFKN